LIWNLELIRSISAHQRAQASRQTLNEGIVEGEDLDQNRQVQQKKWTIGCAIPLRGPL
jgi:hypothetical protein